MRGKRGGIREEDGRIVSRGENRGDEKDGEKEERRGEKKREGREYERIDRSGSVRWSEERGEAGEEKGGR